MGGPLRGRRSALFFLRDTSGAPAKTPRPVVDKLNAALRAALTDKDLSAKLQAAGIEPAASSPEELKNFVNLEISKWAKIVAEAKIEPE